jgi:hypothetical protein
MRLPRVGGGRRGIGLAEGSFGKGYLVVGMEGIMTTMCHEWRRSGYS